MKLIDYCWVFIMMTFWFCCFCAWLGCCMEDAGAGAVATLFFVPLTYCIKKAVDALL